MNNKLKAMLQENINFTGQGKSRSGLDIKERYQELKESVLSKCDTIHAIFRLEGNNGLNVDWGTIGSMEYVNEQLDNILEYINHV